MRRDRGAALVVALAVLAGLVALVGVLASAHSGSMTAETNRMALRRATLMAESGIQRGVAELQSKTNAAATVNDSWSSLGSAGSVQFDVGIDSFRLQIVDSSSRINVNSADHDTLAKLSLTSDQVDCLLDWREKAATPRPQGAKDAFYNGLQHPYNAKLQSLTSVDELLLVRGITPEDLYAASTTPLAELLTTNSASADQDPNGNQKLDITGATISQLTALGVPPQIASSVTQTQGAFAKMGDVIAVQGMDQSSAKIILNNCQVGPGKQASGLVNLNTAPLAVLSAVPGVDPDVASAIVDRQSTGFKGLGDLVDIPGLSIANLSRIVDKFCTTSQTFQIRSLGSAAGMTVGLEAFASVDTSGKVTISRVQPIPFANVPAHWGWADQTTTRETVMGEW